MKTSPWLIGGIVVAAGVAAWAIYNMTQGKTPSGPVSKPVDNTGKDIVKVIGDIGGMIDDIFGAFGGKDKTSEKNPGAGDKDGDSDGLPDLFA